MDLTVVILSWNTRELLEKCLRSILCPGPALALETIVVDNASQDDSRQMVTALFPGVRLLVNKKNLGFGAGNNAAIPAATGRYVLFLNSDTTVTPGALDAMVRYADEHPEIGVLGPKLLNADGTLQYSCRRYPNLGTGFFRNTPLGRLFPNNRFTTDYLLSDWDHASPRDVDWVSGAALMIRRPLLEQLLGFDEEYYFYCEDVDLCWRVNHTQVERLQSSPQGQDAPASDTRITPRASDAARSARIVAPNDTDTVSQQSSWRVTYYPEAVIYHLIGKSSDKVPTRMTYEFHKSQYLFYRKHYAADTPLLVRPLIPIGIGLRAVGQMTRYRVNYWRRVLRGKERAGRRRR